VTLPKPCLEGPHKVVSVEKVLLPLPFKETTLELSLIDKVQFVKDLLPLSIFSIVKVVASIGFVLSLMLTDPL
jgi:hypothetical protein